MARKELDPTDDVVYYAVVRWTPYDIMSVSTLDFEAATEWLELNARWIEDAQVQAGNDAIRQLLSEEQLLEGQ